MRKLVTGDGPAAADAAEAFKAGLHFRAAHVQRQTPHKYSARQHALRRAPLSPLSLLQALGPCPVPHPCCRRLPCSRLAPTCLLQALILLLAVFSSFLLASGLLLRVLLALSRQGTPLVPASRRSSILLFCSLLRTPVRLYQLPPPPGLRQQSSTPSSHSNSVPRLKYSENEG